MTRIEGEYQLMLDLRKDQRFFPWDFDSNNDNDGAQLRLFSTLANAEAFVKVEADWRNPENNTPDRSSSSARRTCVTPGTYGRSRASSLPSSSVRIATGPIATSSAW